MRMCFLCVVSCLVLVAQPVWARGADDFSSRFAAGQASAKDNRHAEARAEFEKALASPGITPDESAQALMAIADTYTGEWKWLLVGETLQKAIALENVSPAVRASALLKMGKLQETRDWSKCKEAYAAALQVPGIVPGQKTVGQKGLVKALSQLREFAAARDVLRDLIASRPEAAGKIPGKADDSVPPIVLQEFVARAVLPDEERAAMQLALAKTLLVEAKYDEARGELATALAMPGITKPQQADAQLGIGLSHYDAGDYERAKPELLKVTQMPESGTRPPWDGGRMGYVPSREALLRLKLRHLVPDEGKELKVLFIGSSHTLRGNLPDLVMQLAASAPADRPRVIAGDYVRMGTSMKMFWDAGDGPDTARGVIAAEPWDAVVVETFYNMNGEQIRDYTQKFVDVIRGRKATPVIYESPLPKAAPYPERFQQFHDDNVGLVRSLKLSVAPSVAAWMRLLGPKPTPEQFGVVYDDWIHASPRGAYITGCCLYAALTGASPVGLYHPASIPEAESKSLQDCAWEAYRETNKP